MHRMLNLKPRGHVQADLFYGERLEALGQEQRDALKMRRRMQVVLLLAVALAAALALLALRNHVSWWMPALPLVCLLVVPRYTRLLRRLARIAALIEFHTSGLQRSLGEAKKTSDSGEDLWRPGHLYQSDLNILGPSSLFSLLATVRTRAGRTQLAEFLLSSPELAACRARQDSIQELTRQTGLREELGTLGDSAGTSLPSPQFEAWLRAAPVSFRPIVRPLLIATTSLSIAGLVMVATGPLSPSLLWPNIAAVFAIQAAVVLRLRKDVVPALARAKPLHGEVDTLRRGLLLLQERSYATAKLQQLQAGASQPSLASDELQHFQTLLTLLDQRAREWIYLPSLLLCMGTQTAISLERWRQQHGANLARWSQIWGEFEALNALATYAFEHPQNTYPDLLSDGDPTFKATGLCHPLLSPKTCVPNDISLNSEIRMYLISGSNMAGKSTLLRSVGANAVLAFAGAPIPAISARISLCTVCASIGLSDSLADGRSKFLAEVERIERTLAATRGDLPVLFLIDEIFSGTNTTDRHKATEGILTALLDRGALGAISTHDLALTALVEQANLRGINVHMASPDAADPLDFDYKLKPGVNTTSSAAAILRLVGL